MIRFETAVNLAKLRDVEADWYVATPYSKYPGVGVPGRLFRLLRWRRGLLWLAFREAARATAVLVRHGIPAYSPIAHTHPVAIFGRLDPLDHTIWLPADARQMAAAVGLIVVKMPTWDSSYGIAHEVDAFRAAGKPILYMEWPQP